MRIDVDHEAQWRKLVAEIYPAAEIVTGRRLNRDNLKAKLDDIEVALYRRDDNEPPGGYIDLSYIGVVSARRASTTEIGTCPFCKGIGYMNSVPHNPNCADEAERDYYVRCNSCGCEGPWAKSETSAIRLWNMRTP